MARSSVRGATSKVDIVPIEQLIADPENARVHNPRNIGLIQDSIHAVGAARSGVIDEDGIIRSGNGMHEARGTGRVGSVGV